MKRPVARALRSSSHTLPILFLLAAVVTSLAGSGCSLLHSGSSSPELVDGRIPFEMVDRRQLSATGYSVHLNDDYTVSVEASEKDTLLWFQQRGTGRFMHAFLRRGNTVYVAGLTGDYEECSPSQSAMYSMIMKAWHDVVDEGGSSQAADLSGGTY